MNAVTNRPRSARRIGQMVALAASLGLAVTMASTAVFADPGPAAPQTAVEASGPQVGTAEPAAVVVPADSEWTIATTDVSGEKPAPPPVVRTPDTASRSSERTDSYSGTDPRSIARSMVAARGWGSGQFDCLDSLWQKESNWNPHAENPSSGAYGIPQALPGSKMGTVASDWRTNASTQITWGLNYIAGRYGTPCAAWSHSQAVNWY